MPRPIEPSDVEAAKRGLEMTRRSPEDLLGLIRAHAGKPLFASQVIAVAAAEVRNAKLKRTNTQ